MGRMTRFWRPSDINRGHQRSSDPSAQGHNQPAACIEYTRIADRQCSAERVLGQRSQLTMKARACTLDMD